MKNKKCGTKKGKPKSLNKESQLKQSSMWAALFILKDSLVAQQDYLPDRRVKPTSRKR